MLADQIKVPPYSFLLLEQQGILSKLSRSIVPQGFKCRTTLHDTMLNICYHNVCIEIESLGYLFIFKFSALGDKTNQTLFCILLVITKSDN